MDFWDLLLDIGMLLMACLLFGTVTSRLGLSSIVGYLFAGMLLGGVGSLNLIKSPEEIETISELGVALLLFSLGLEFSWKEIISFKKNTLLAAVLQVTLTPLLVIGFCTLISLPLINSIIIGLVVTLSSTATVLKTLQDLGEVDSNYGRNATAVLLTQDLIVIPFSILVSLLMLGGQKFDPMNIVNVVGGLLILVVGLYLLLDKVVLKALGFLTVSNRDMAMLLAVVTGIGSAWAAHSIGVSPAIGAFIAGMFLGNSSFATQIRADVTSFRVVLLTLFFGSVGMIADGLWICQNFGLVLVTAIAVVLFKILITTPIFIATRNTIAISATSAICLSQIGEFAFLLSNQAKAAELIDQTFYQLIIGTTIFTLFVTPLLIKFAPRMGLLLQKACTKCGATVDPEAMTHLETDNEVYVFGFGPSGMEVVRRLKDRKFNPIVIDLNPESKKIAEAMGLRSYIGDIRQIEILEHFGIKNAKLIVITIPSHDAALKAIANIRKLAPDAYLIVRSRYQIHKSSFEQSGAHLVINEEFTVGDKLAKAAIVHLRQ